MTPLVSSLFRRLRRAIQTLLTVVACTVILKTGAFASEPFTAAGKAPPVPLGDSWFREQVSVTLHTAIFPNGPGSWTHNAGWDEFAIAVKNSGAVPLTLEAVELTDARGATFPAGTDPRVIEEASRASLASGSQEAKSPPPKSGKSPKESLMIHDFFASGEAARAAALVKARKALPYYLTRGPLPTDAGPAEIAKEFQARRLGLPAILAPKQSTQGSVFFPCTRNSTLLLVHARIGDRRVTVRVDFSLLWKTSAEAGARFVGTVRSIGDLRIECEHGVEFTLDDRPARESSYEAGGLIFPRLLAGEHRLVMRKAGFRPLTIDPVVRSGETTTLAVFALQPETARSPPVAANSPRPLQALAHARATVDGAAGLASVTSGGNLGPAPAADQAGRARSDTAVRSALGGATMELRETEARVAGQFRREYAAFRLVTENVATAPAKKSAAWRALVERWEIPAGENPQPLVWRNHRPDVARGELRVTFSEPWPENLAPPKRFIDGAEILATPSSPPPSPLSGWDFIGLSVGTHKLRIEHPAIIPAMADVPIEDGRLTEIKWAPKFIKAPNTP